VHSHEDLLTAFSLSAVLRLRRRFQALAELYRQQRGNTSCGAANRRSEKNAFSEAASIFPLRLPLRGLKGASSPFLVDPARRNRWWFSGSLLTSKENISLSEKALCPAHRRATLVLFWFSFGTQKRTISLNEKALFPAPQAQEPFLVLFWRTKENYPSSSTRRIASLITGYANPRRASAATTRSFRPAASLPRYRPSTRAAAASSSGSPPASSGA